MQSVLVVTHDFPYPPTHGGRVDMWNRLQALSQLGYAVDLVASVKKPPSDGDVQEVRKYVRHLYIVERSLRLRTFISALPYSVATRFQLAAIPLTSRYHAVILEGEHVGPILDNPSLDAVHYILRLHNNESHYYHELSLSSTSFKRRVFYALESIRFRFYSRTVIRRCHALWFISDSERLQYNSRWHSLLPAPHASFVPPSIPLASMRRHPLTGSTILFVGRLGFATNAQGLEWYLREVHHRFDDLAAYRFVMAGNTDGESILRLQALAADRGRVSLVKNPVSLDDLYGSAAVFANPVFHGAGLQLKTINAIEAGLPVVSTSVGVRGTRFVHKKHVLIADTPADFAHCIRQLLSDRQFASSLVNEAQDFLRKEWDQERIMGDLLRTIQ